MSGAARAVGVGLEAPNSPTDGLTEAGGAGSVVGAVLGRYSRRPTPRTFLVPTRRVPRQFGKRRQPQNRPRGPSRMTIDPSHRGHQTKDSTAMRVSLPTPWWGRHGPFVPNRRGSPFGERRAWEARPIELRCRPPLRASAASSRGSSSRTGRRRTATDHGRAGGRSRIRAGPSARRGASTGDRSAKRL